MRPSGLEVRKALAVAMLAFGLAAPAAYLAERAYEVLVLGRGANPALLIGSAHTAFYWRAATATWWAGLAAAIALGWARRGEQAANRLTGWMARMALSWGFTVVVLAWVLS